MNNAALKDSKDSEQNNNERSIKQEIVTWERVVPDKLDKNVSFQKKILEQHLERYNFATQFVQDKFVVDAACGAGYGAEILFNAGAKGVIGVDIDSDTIEYARKRYGRDGITFITRNLDNFTFNISDLGVSGGKIDLITSFETVEHLISPQDYLRRVKTALVDDGLFIASVPTVPTVDIDEFHKHDFSEKSWRSLVCSYGFEIISELPQKYTASIAELQAESKAKNTTDGARRNRASYYLRHPYSFIRRYTRLFLFGLELDMLTVVCRKAR